MRNPDTSYLNQLIITIYQKSPFYPKYKPAVYEKNLPITDFDQ